jgi:hypothetical protein
VVFIGGVKSVLWVKVVLGGPLFRSVDHLEWSSAKFHGRTDFPTSNPLLTDLT